MASGTIVKIKEDKGFGFIKPADGGKDLFFHVTGLANRNDFENLTEGQQVRYELDSSGDKPRAKDVEALH